MKRAFGTIGTLLAVAILATSGCEGDISGAPGVSDVSGAPEPPAPEPPGGAGAAQPAAAETDTAAEPAAEPGAPPAAAEPDATAAGGAAEPAMVAEKAAVGAGVKGRDYGGPGFVTTPVQEYFRAGERIAFDIQIPNAMKLYKASHNDKGPPTQQEFMKVIIQENGVALPELPAGEEYFYDPASEQLLVKKPAA